MISIYNPTTTAGSLQRDNPCSVYVLLPSLASPGNTNKKKSHSGTYLAESPRNLLLRVWKSTSAGHFLKEPPFKRQFHCLRIQASEAEVQLDEQGTPFRFQEEKEIIQSQEERSGFTGRIQSPGLHMQGEGMKGQNWTRVKIAQCCLRQQEGFFKYFSSKWRSKENIGSIHVSTYLTNMNDDR